MDQPCPIGGVAKRIGGRGCGGFAVVGCRTKCEGPPGPDGSPLWPNRALFCGESACREAAGWVNEETRSKNAAAQQRRHSVKEKAAPDTAQPSFDWGLGVDSGGGCSSSTPVAAAMGIVMDHVLPHVPLVSIPPLVTQPLRPRCCCVCSRG